MRFGEQVDRHRPGVVLAALLLVSVLMLTFSSQNVVLKPKELGLTLFSSIQRSFHEVGSFVSSTVNSVRELGQLRSDYDLLLDQLRSYEGIENDVVELRHEVERLRSIVGFSEGLSYTNVPAQIIGKDPGNLFSSITINKGSRDGMQTNLPVVSVQEGNQGLVGKIEHVGLNSSIIRPIFDASTYVAARLQDSRYEGLVNGAGSEELDVTMRYVASQARENLVYGDLVITSGMNSIYPKGIHIGRVSSIQARPYQTSLELKLEPIVDFERLEYVFVIVSGD